MGKTGQDQDIRRIRSQAVLRDLILHYIDGCGNDLKERRPLAGLVLGKTLEDLQLSLLDFAIEKRGEPIRKILAIPLPARRYLLVLGTVEASAHNIVIEIDSQDNISAHVPAKGHGHGVDEPAIDKPSSLTIKRGEDPGHGHARPNGIHQ